MSRPKIYAPSILDYLPSTSSSNAPGSPVCPPQCISRLHPFRWCPCSFAGFASHLRACFSPAQNPPGLLATCGNKTPVPTQSVTWPTPQPYLPPRAPPCLPSSHADVLPRSFPEVKPPRSSLPQAWDACHLDGHTALAAHPSGLCSPA